MIQYIPLAEAGESLAPYIARHSGDETRVYKEVNGQKLLISLYYPPDYDAERSYPLFVFIHGGGWQGRKVFADQADWAGDYLGFLARRYAEKGYLCASIDYRLMRQSGQEDGYGLMDIYEDCADAVQYLRAHAKELGADLGRAVLLGESAGGYLAAALITLKHRDTAIFKTAILVNAVTDLSDPRWRARLPENSTHPLLEGKSMAEKIAMLSPAMHISEDTCDTLLIHGAEDSCVFPFHSLKFYDLLKACGRAAQMDFIEETDHAFLLAEYMRERQHSLDAASIGIQSIDCWLKKLRLFKPLEESST